MSSLEERARRLGIRLEYRDCDGRVRTASPETLQALVAILSEGAAPAGDGPAADDEQRAPRPAERLGGRRGRGVSAAAASLHRSDGWGTGDLRDVELLCEWAGRRELDFVGLLPLCLLPTDGSSASPYSPSSRLWWHPGRLDPESLPEWERSAWARDGARAAQLAERKGRLRAREGLPHGEDLALRLEVLRELHAIFAATERGRAGELGREHERFLAEGGRELQDVATFEAMRLDGPGAPDPGTTRDSAEVEAFRREHPEAVDFQVWLQLRFETRLREVGRRAREAGLPLGLLLDLPVGSARAGAECWARPGLHARGASLGAPPDPLGPQGQDWDLVPWNPHALRRESFATWRRLVGRPAAAAGALRVDHVLGLVRQFWIPAGRPAAEGAYVDFPHDALLEVLVAEARRTGCVLVGEDLGTVPEGLRETLARRGVLGTRLLLFEREESGEFRPPEAWSPCALAAFGTHDVPPLAGWWSGRDLELRAALGLLPDEPAAREQRDRDRQALARWLGGEPADLGGLARRVHERLQESSCELVAFQLDDLLLEEEPLNLPGVPPERWPSWSRRHRVPVDRLERHAAVSATLPPAS